MKPEDDKKLDLTTGIADLEVADKIRDIQHSFETGQLTRRSFMAGALAVVFLIVACTSATAT